MKAFVLEANDMRHSRLSMDKRKPGRLGPIKALAVGARAGINEPSLHLCDPTQETHLGLSQDWCL